MKLIGVDYGRRRIGVAVSDDEGIIARGLSVIDRNVSPNYVYELLKIIEDEKPDALVVGLPLGANDEETVMSGEAREFAEIIRERTGSSIPIHFIDESFSSRKAAELMTYRKKKARRDKSLSDRIAACLILQNFIDGGMIGY